MKAYFNQQKKWMTKIFKQVVIFLRKALLEMRQFKNILEEFKLKCLRRNLMYELLLSFSQVPFHPVSILSVDYGYTIKLLLTN